MDKNKQCGKCLKMKPLIEFYDKKRSKVRVDGSVHKWVGKYSACKPCVDGANSKARIKYDDYYKQYRINNKDRQSFHGKNNYIINNQAWVRLIKGVKDLKCAHCGYDRTWAGLDFHHVDPREKETTIHAIIKSGKPTEERWEAMKLELDKCEVLCATCHREEHMKYNWLDDGEKMIKEYKK